MRRTIVICQAILYGMLIAKAASATTQYQPVMSKDDKLCDTVLSTMNHDLTEFGKIRYGSHPATPVIDWRRMSELDSRFSDGECESFRWARFDLNNDNKTDFVVKKSLCWVDGEWKGIEDSLWAFEGSYSGYKIATISQEVLEAYKKAGIGYLKFPGYFLPDISPSYEDLRVETNISSPMAVNPFRYQGSTYLHIDSEVPNVRNITVHIVAKYTREALPPISENKTPDILLPVLRYKGLEDICYFMAEVPERRLLERSEDGYILRP